MKFTAAGLFLLALAINVKVTLDDPFQMVSEQALATGSDSGPGGGCPNGQTPVQRVVSNYYLNFSTWFPMSRTEYDRMDCVYKTCHSIDKKDGTCTFTECQ